MSRYWRLTLLAFGVTAILAVAVGTLAGVSTASPQAEQALMGRPKFIVRY
jgi:hypothetical protein